MYLDAQGQVIDGKSLYTHHAVGVPGTVAGLTHALQQWGTLPLARLRRSKVPSCAESNKKCVAIEKSAFCCA